jgi:hypothetical protein
MNRQTNELIHKVAGTEHDFEWYPTSDAIIYEIDKDMKENLHHCVSFLDCGAGNGKVIEALLCDPNIEGSQDGKIERGYAIEKSQPLLDAIDPSIFVIGTEFMEQTLIDKKVDVVFSNPPYSQFETWAVKIIREANAKYVYLVMPKRWADKKAITCALELREAKWDIIYSYNFVQSENRKARTEVDLVRISLGFRHSAARVDPFEVWFDSMFNIEGGQTDNLANRESAKTRTRKEKLEGSMIKGVSLVDQMEELYLEELDHYIKMYQSVMDLDSDIMAELDVNKKSVSGALKMRIEGLKNIYWRELFDRLNVVTKRLTTKTRRLMLDKLQSNTSVDFSVKNAQAILSWVIKQANGYFDSQLIDVFEGLFSLKNIHLYKSNERVFDREDTRWARVRADNCERYMLDYRTVHEMYEAIVPNGSFRPAINGLSEQSANFLNDIVTVANNLGYASDFRASDFKWSSGKEHHFLMLPTRDGVPKTLMAVRAYKNGNIHIKFNQSFIKTLNVEFGRLKGWLRNKQEAAHETNYSFDEISTKFKSNFALEKDGLLMLTAA